MPTRVRPKPAPKMLSINTVAALLDMDLRTLRRRVRQGDFPKPHTAVGITWLWPAELINTFIHDGLWPDGTEFYRR